MRFFNSPGMALLLVFISLQSRAQTVPDAVFRSNIKTIRFHVYGDQLSMPVYKLGSDDRLELHFDDMDANVKSYYYTYELCDYDWKPVQLSPFDYIKGFTQMRITNYRYSSIAYTRYTHYQVYLPENNSLPTRSGNYRIKVFLDGDTSKLVFIKALLVLDSRSAISTQIVQPFTPQTYRTHQRIKFTVKTDGLNIFDATRQVRVRVLQNYRWDNALGEDASPTFIRGGSLEYNMENLFVFPGGKEWRWLDLRSFQLLSDRVDSAHDTKKTVDIYVRPDIDRSGEKYIYYPDYNGLYELVNYQQINPYWQADYATVHFKFVTPDEAPYPGKDLYLIGQMTDYKLNNQTKMTFNKETKMYEGSLFLKQGYYSYSYLLADQKDPSLITQLDGNYWESENVYTILVYYKAFNDQADRLIGVSRINSRIDRPGFSF